MHNKLWIIPTAIVSHSNDTSLQLHRHQFQWFPGLGADPCISQSEPAPVFITNAKSTQCKSLYGDVPEPQFIYIPKTSRSFRREDNYHCSRRTMGLVTNVTVWHVSPWHCHMHWAMQGWFPEQCRGDMGQELVTLSISGKMPLPVNIIEILLPALTLTKFWQFQDILLK